MDIESVVDATNYSNTTRKRTPYADIVNRALGRIGDLEAKRAAMLNNGSETDNLKGAELLAALAEELPD